MDDPVAEIRGVVLQLTTGSRQQQQEALEKNFTRDASFKHPFCAVTGDRDAILRIFQWYKILSPRIQLNVNSVAFDEANEMLYLNITQVFKVWFIPFYAATVNLTTVLQLIQGSRTRRTVPESDKYYIQSQEDLYQVDEFVKFFLPFHIGTTIVALWHWIATWCCIIGAIVLGPVMAVLMELKTVTDQAAVDAKYLLSNGEATQEEQRRDSGPTDRSGGGTMQGMKKVVGSENAKKSVRELERQSNLGEAKAQG